MPSWPQLFNQVQTKIAIQSDPLKGLGQKIMDLCPAPAKLLEVGCGSGILAGYFQDFGYNVVATDKDPAVLAYAKKRLIEEMLGMPVFLEADAFDLSGLKDFGLFDCAFSQGLLEHFEDAQIVELLRQQLAVAKLCIFSVPSENYPRQEFGDERNLPGPHWFSLMEPLNELAEPTISYYGNGQHLLRVLKRRNE